LLVIVRFPPPPQLIAPPWLLPEVVLPVRITPSSVVLSPVPPPRMPPPPKVVPVPPEIVTPEKLTVIPPSRFGSSSKTRWLAIVWWMIVLLAPAPTMFVAWLVAALPTWSSVVPTLPRLYVPAGTLITFGLPALLAVLLAASTASRRLIRPSGPGLAASAP